MAPVDGGDSRVDIKQVRELVKLVEDSGIEELEVSHKDTTIRIQKACHAHHGSAVVAQAPAVAPPIPVATAPAAAPAADPVRAKWREIRSPIVGTYYRSPAPDAEPFIKVGDQVRKGQTLCIIEAMKVMNEIEAEAGGVIKDILVENGQPVESEAILFLIDPD